MLNVDLLFQDGFCGRRAKLMFRHIFSWFGKVLSSSAPQRPNADFMRRSEAHDCQRCHQSQVIHITLVRERKMVGETHLCEECARSYLEAEDVREEQTASAANPADEVAIEVAKVIISEIHDQQVLMF